MKKSEELINTLGMAVVISKYVGVVIMLGLGMTSGVFAMEFACLGLEND